MPVANYSRFITSVCTKMVSISPLTGRFCVCVCVCIYIFIFICICTVQYVFVYMDMKGVCVSAFIWYVLNCNGMFSVKVNILK